MKKLNKKKVIIWMEWIMVLLISGCGFAEQSEKIEFVDATTQVVSKDAGQLENTSVTTQSSTTELENLCVYICGAVVKNDVYYLQPGARMIDAVHAAGGFTKNADENVLNLAEPIVDGQRIYIPKVGENIDKEALSRNQLSDSTDAGPDSNQINLNSASKEELMTLPGVGASKADAIISYREEHGGFQTVEEIKQIRGIKDGVYEKIKGRIVVG